MVEQTTHDTQPHDEKDPVWAALDVWSQDGAQLLFAVADPETNGCEFRMVRDMGVSSQSLEALIKQGIIICKDVEGATAAPTFDIEDYETRYMFSPGWQEYVEGLMGE